MLNSQTRETRSNKHKQNRLKKPDKRGIALESSRSHFLPVSSPGRCCYPLPAEKDEGFEFGALKDLVKLDETETSEFFYFCQWD